MIQSWSFDFLLPQLKWLPKVNMFNFISSKKIKGYIVNRYLCLACGLVYDEKLGIPEHGIEPGTKWHDLPDDWFCPECGVGKADFRLIDF